MVRRQYMAEEIRLNNIPNIKILTDAYLDYQESIVSMIYARFKGHLDRLKVEDIFSYAFVDTCEKIQKGKFDLEASEKSIKSYLYKVCYWQACKKVGRNKEDKMPEIHKGEDAGSVDEGQLMRLMGVVNAHEGGNEIINACDEEECEHAMNDAFFNMKESCRKVLLEHYWDGFSYDQIAEKLNKKATAVKMQAKRCKDSFTNSNKHLLEICRK